MKTKLVLMAYCRAIQTSKYFTTCFLLNRREMRLPVNIMYRSSECRLSKAEYAINVRNTLKQAYEKPHKY